MSQWAKQSDITLTASDGGEYAKVLGIFRTDVMKALYRVFSPDGAIRSATRTPSMRLLRSPKTLREAVTGSIGSPPILVLALRWLAREAQSSNPAKVGSRWMPRHGSTNQVSGHREPSKR